MKLAYRILSLVQLTGTAGLGYNHLFFAHELAVVDGDHGGVEAEDLSVLFAAMIFIGFLRIFMKYMNGNRLNKEYMNFYFKSVNYSVVLDVVSIIVFMDYILFDFVFP